MTRNIDRSYVLSERDIASIMATMKTLNKYSPVTKPWFSEWVNAVLHGWLVRDCKEASLGIWLLKATPNEVFVRLTMKHPLLFECLKTDDKTEHIVEWMEAVRHDVYDL